MNNNNFNNIFGSLDIIDIISIISFIAQIQNMKGDETDKIKNNSILKAVADEIDRLHKENNIIINKLEEIKKDDEKCKEYLYDIYNLLERRL